MKQANILVRGYCAKGHKIKSEEDYYTSFHRRPDGSYRKRYVCRVCNKNQAINGRERRRNESETRRYSKRTVHLKCDGAIVFAGNYLPGIGEEIWCIRHRHYSPVVRWGSIIPVESRVPGSEDD